MPADHTEVVGARYALTRELGRNSSFAVYEAEDHRRAAVAGVAWSLDPMARRRKGRRSLGKWITRTDHPHLISSYDHGVEGDRPFVAFHRPPSDLATELALAPFPARRVAQMGAELSSALEALHRAHVRLGALHPGHVGVDADGSARLSPWPLAPPPVGWGGEGAWSPPEARAGATPSVTGDVWSLGAVLLSALVGTGPGQLSAADTDDLAHRLRAAADPALLDAVGTSMEADPSRRFASAGDMAAAIQRDPGVVAGSGAVATAASSRWSRPGSGVATRAVAFTSAAIVVVTAATAAGMSLNAVGGVSGGGSMALSCAGGGSASPVSTSGGTCAPRSGGAAQPRASVGGASGRDAVSSGSAIIPSPVPVGSSVALAAAPATSVASVDSLATPPASSGSGIPSPSSMTPSLSVASADNVAASRSTPVAAPAPATAPAPPTAAPATAPATAAPATAPAPPTTAAPPPTSTSSGPAPAANTPAPAPASGTQSGNASSSGNGGSSDRAPSPNGQQTSGTSSSLSTSTTGAEPGPYPNQSQSQSSTGPTAQSGTQGSGD